MKGEVDAAVNFLIKLIKQNSNLNVNDLSKFEASLRYFLLQKFNNHWHPERPWQGQGYRCLRVNGMNRKEPTIAKAALECGLKYSDLNLPLELTLWVDPEEVCCRFGEQKGSYCTVASFREGKKESYIDEIDLRKITKPLTECNNANAAKEQPMRQLSATLQVSPVKTPFSRKENVVPLSERTPTSRLGPNFQNKERRLKESFDSVRGSGRNFSGNSSYLFKENILTLEHRGGYMYNQNENIPPTYYNPSWINYPTSVSPPKQTFPSNGYYSCSPPRFSPQENLGFSRHSPVNANNFRWNSGPYVGEGGAFPKNGWYGQKLLGRV